ncbi:MAG: VCBS repeat-containing protein, partial [Planctomycetales bacterium]|nr:VCBS repeat-containing protein [Planctomycetales bacterium]
DQHGQPFSDEQLRGKVWIANFTFTRCRGTCPEQTRRMAELQQALQEQPTWAGIHLLSISVDPEYDQPDVLKEYAEQAGADPEHWHFLTGERAKIWEVSKVGFRLPVAEDAKNEQMPIMHESKFVLVDRSGQIRGYFDLLTSEGRQALSRALNHVLPEMPDQGSLAAQLPGDAPAVPVTHLAQPPEILDIDWLKARAEQQQASLAATKLTHDFEFRHAIDDSGIDYDPQIVDEQRWRLKVNHYDHGTGVAVGDVDGDGALDLYFVSQIGANALYRNRGDGTFENTTKQAGVALLEHVGVAAAMADYDNDGDVDLFVTNVLTGNVLLENNGQGVFEDVSQRAGLDYRGHSSGAVFFDYDLDGDLDLYVTNVGKYTTDEEAEVRRDAASKLAGDGPYHYRLGTPDSFAGHLKPGLAESSRLYRNEGDGTFADVTEATGLLESGWSGAATPLDVNRDGYPDLYVLNMQGSDAYYENVRGEKFVARSRELFPATPWGAMGVKSLDFNNDGWFDLFVTDMHSDMSENVGPEAEKRKSNMQWAPEFLRTKPGESIFGNAFYRREAEGGFQEVSGEIGAENYWPWGLSVGDVNADGFDDAFLASSMCFPYRYAANSLLLNQAGERWVDSEFALRVEPRPAGKRIRPWFVLDLDGEDQGNELGRDRTGRVVVWSTLGSRSSALLDIDGDGDLDLITNDFNSPPQLLVSDLAQR